jgi:general secretion pathway protein G
VERLSAVRRLTMTGLLLITIALVAAYSYIRDPCTSDTCRRIGAVAEAVCLFRLETGQLPPTLNDLVESRVPRWNGPYLRNPSVLVDEWGKPLLYTIGPDTKQFEIRSLGADAATGGRGAAADIARDFAQCG